MRRDAGEALAERDTHPGLFVEIKRKRSSDDVVAQIKDAIIEGRISSGQGLPNERELCRIFGVSRPTLREGLRTLEAFGVIEIRPGATGGIFACEPQGDQVGAALEALLRFRRVTAHELAEFRVGFESETAALAARRAEADDVARLTELAERFNSMTNEENLPWRALVSVDVAFHEALARASKNQVRVAIMLGIHSALSQAESSIADQAGSALRRSIASELRAIAAAVAAGNASRAANLTRRHVKKFSELERSLEAAARG